jgi:hypothetical protein
MNFIEAEEEEVFGADIDLPHIDRHVRFEPAAALTEEDIAKLRAAAEMQQEYRENQDETVGGLLTTEGEDVRQRREAEEDPDQRRTKSWRGMALSPQASIQWDFAIETFDYKVQAMDLSSKLLIYLLFLAAFMFFFLIERDITDNFFLQKVVYDPLFGSEIAKLKVRRYFSNISTASMMNDYFCDVTLIQTVDYTYPTGGNFFLGAVRMRTQRVRQDSCTVNPSVIPPTMPSIFQECYAALDSTTEDTGVDSTPYNNVPLWSYKTCAEVGNSLSIEGWITSYHCGGYIFEIPFWRPMNAYSLMFGQVSTTYPFPESTHERLPFYASLYQYAYPPLYNSNPPFLDDLATRFVAIEMFLYNPALRTFVSAKMYSEVANGGFWVPNTNFRVFQIWTPESIPETVYDAFFYLFVFFYVYQLVMDAVRFRRRDKKLLAFFFDLWNVLEIANLAIFMVVLGFRIAWIKRCVDADLRIDYLTYTQQYPTALDGILDDYSMQVYLNSINIVLTFLKMLKFLRLNDRLNVLTRTLSASQDSIVGVLLIFLLIVTAYAMTGYGLFGLGVWGFRSIGSSFATLLQILVGDINYEPLRNENRIEAGFFFWSYVILAFFILLNFLIGVLMEAFGEVSKSKPLLPLENVIAKSWADWKRTLSPAYLWLKFKQLLQGNTTESLLMDAVELLRAYRDEKYPPQAAVPIDQQVMQLQDVEAALPDELIERIGRAYMAYIWDDLVYEWDTSNEAESKIAAQREVEMTARGVKSAIGRQLRILELFPSRMAELEKNLNILAEKLSKRN